MLKALLIRQEEDAKQTLGNFILYDGTDQIFSAKTLELPWIDNEQFISCIPPGIYICKRRHSARFGHHFIVCDVKGREFILIHCGNFNRDIKGCIALGHDHLDINQDGYRDVTSSRQTMKRLNNAVDEILFALTIIDSTRVFK